MSSTNTIPLSTDLAKSAACAVKPGTLQPPFACLQQKLEQGLVAGVVDGFHLGAPFDGPEI
ncbi:hypothetical protein PSCICP_18500 [Pseudomonas cichorii]|uniref:Uncharacterized protein n=1 Tax=Pseudomonas cichorii TaxID=36746 RepID=A0ABQ1DLI9_PSECI|nr:hypothetical protein PSCICP_18500 [Pseudomonas cichorii]